MSDRFPWMLALSPADQDACASTRPKPSSAPDPWRRAGLSALVDEAHRAHEPAYLTRREHAVAAIVDADQRRQLLEDADELADIRAVDAAWKETQRLGETPVRARTSNGTSASRELLPRRGHGGEMKKVRCSKWLAKGAFCAPDPCSGHRAGHAFLSVLKLLQGCDLYHFCDEIRLD